MKKLYTLTALFMAVCLLASCSPVKNVRTTYGEMNFLQRLLGLPNPCPRFFCIVWMGRKGGRWKSRSMKAEKPESVRR